MRLRRRSEGGRSISLTVTQFNGAAAMWVRVRRLVRTRYLRHLSALHTQALTSFVVAKRHVSQLERWFNLTESLAMRPGGLVCGIGAVLAHSCRIQPRNTNACSRRTLCKPSESSRTPACSNSLHNTRLKRKLTLTSRPGLVDKNQSGENHRGHLQSTACHSWSTTIREVIV